MIGSASPASQAGRVTMRTIHAAARVMRIKAPKCCGR
jgi:hypothetical protein